MRQPSSASSLASQSVENVKSCRKSGLVTYFAHSIVEKMCRCLFEQLGRKSESVVFVTT